jgi:hypothetical protein
MFMFKFSGVESAWAGAQAGRCAGYGTCIFTTSHAPSEK